MGVQLGDEARHLFLERLAVVFDLLGPDIAAGGEDVAVRGDLGSGGGFAEAGNISVRMKFEGKMTRLVAELHTQFAESAKLEQAIKANLRGLDYGG